MRVAYFCMDSIFSFRPLQALLAADVDVRLVMQPVGGVLGRHENLLKRESNFRNLFLKRKPTLASDESNPFVLAAQAGIPSWSVGNASTPAVLDLLRRERIELIVIAFFNQLLRPEIFQMPAFGAINAHPSLLPELRGPSPLFWTFQQGKTKTGVSIHEVAAGEDDGVLFLQNEISLETPLAGDALLILLAEKAAHGLLQVVKQKIAGNANGIAQRGNMSRAPRPGLEDLKLNPSMGAERIFRFVRGVGRWSPPALMTSGAPIRVTDAIDVLEEKKIPGDYAIVGDHILLGTSTGTVVLRHMGV